MTAGDDLHASGSCQVALWRPDGSVDRFVFPAPCTLIVGEVWLTFAAGDRKVLPAADGVVPRRASEADVLGAEGLL